MRKITFLFVALFLAVEFAFSLPTDDTNKEIRLKTRMDFIGQMSSVNASIMNNTLTTTFYQIMNN